MGSTLDVFTLYRLTTRGGDCEHFLLLKVTRPGYSNVAQQEEDWANDMVVHKQRQLLDLYTQRFLPQNCRLYVHDVHLEGEFQGCAPGDDLYSEQDARFLTIWTASTRFRGRWIVLGTAESADAFWQEIVEDEDLDALGVQPPVTQRHVFFLSERSHAERAN